MLSNILTIALGLSLAYVFLIFIDVVRQRIARTIYRKISAKNNVNTVFNYKNQRVQQPVKEDKRK